MKELAERFTRKEFSVETRYSLDFCDKMKDFYRVALLADAKVKLFMEEWAGIDAVTPCGNKFLVYCLQPNDNKLRRELLSFGDSIDILYPETLKREVCSFAIKAIERNSSPTPD